MKIPEYRVTTSCYLLPGLRSEKNIRDALLAAHTETTNVRDALNIEFNLSTSKIDIDGLVARYADPVYWSKILKERKEPPLG